MSASLVASEAILAAAGFNLRGALCAARFDALVPEPWRASALLPDARSALVLASGGRALWQAFRASPECDGGADPLDRYTERVVCAAAEVVSRAGQAARALFAHERHGGVYADFVALGRAAGFGAHSRLGLLLHPVYGPWLSIRAVLLTALPWPESPALGAFDPCRGCPAPCAAACPAGAVTADGFRVSACQRTRRREPACRLRCDARRACRLGPEHAYAEAAEAHHMRQVRDA
jgi:epoxyqueuosine reductase